MRVRRREDELVCIRRRPGRSTPRRAARALAALLALLGVVLLATQALLPGIAADRIRSLLEQHGTGISVSVSAFPAIELLFGRADRIKIHVATMYTQAGSGGGIGDMLGRAAGVHNLNASVGNMFVDGLDLQNVTVVKQGSSISGQATVTRAAVQAALPIGLQLATADPNPQTILLTASVSVFGHRLAGTAGISALGGRLMIWPDNPLLAGVRITVFDDPRVSVDSLHASSSGSGYAFLVRGHFL